jgi:hypothetical protein
MARELRILVNFLVSAGSSRSCKIVLGATAQVIRTLPEAFRLRPGIFRKTHWMTGFEMLQDFI